METAEPMSPVRRSARIKLIEITREDSASMCAICLAPMLVDATGNNAVVSLVCSHSFHSRCILRVARTDAPTHGLCPLCRASDSFADEPSETCERVPAEWEPDGILLARAMMLTESGQGSAPLRRQVRKLEKMKAEKHLRIAAVHTFRTNPFHGVLTDEAKKLADATHRAEEREKQVVRTIVGHMRRTLSDRMLDSLVESQLADHVMEDLGSTIHPWRRN
jgi:hypothetical protein